MMGKVIEIKIIKSYAGLSISIESSRGCEFNYPHVIAVSTWRVCWNLSSTASLGGERSDEGKVIKIEHKNDIIEEDDEEEEERLY